MYKGLLLFIAVLLIIGVVPFVGIIEAQMTVNPANYQVPLVRQATITRLGRECRDAGTNSENWHFPSGPGHSIYLDISVAGPGLADEGEPIYSSSDGTVVQAAYTGLGDYHGQYVQISDGVVVFEYLHLSKILVYAGQSVSKGQLIGFMGDSGKSSGAHLHWEAWTVDPVNSFNLYAVPGVSIGGGTHCFDLNDGSVDGSNQNSYWNCNFSNENVIAFDHSDCRGNLRTLQVDVNYAISNYVGHQIRSVHIPPGKSVYLAPDYQYPGEWGICLSSDASNLDNVSYTQYQSSQIPAMNLTQLVGWDRTVYIYVAGHPISRSAYLQGNNLPSYARVFSNSDCEVNGVFYPNTYPNASQMTFVGNYDEGVGGGNTAPWLLEFSRANDGVWDVDIHTRVDVSGGNYSAHRVLVDGVNIGETSAAEQYITWNTFGWADGYHTMRVEYRRVSDNGNWASALSHEEQFYLSPNRAGTAPCDGRDGAELVSGNDCIILTQTFLALDQIGWNDRSNLVVTARGYEVWLEYQSTPIVVPVGQTMSVGNNVSSVELRTPAPPPPPPPSSAFTVDANTVYLFPLNEGAGSQTVDVASGLVGSLGSGVGWVPSQFGNALVFPDAASYGVSTAAFDVCPMTVELWVRKNDTWGNIAGQLGGLNRWSLTFDNLRPKLEIWSAGGSQWITSFNEIQQGTWHYIMFTYDCGARQAKLYLDNVLVGELTTPAVWTSGALPLYIGSSTNGNRCRCEIDEVRISNTVRVPSAAPTATPTYTATATATATNTVEPTATETPVPQTSQLLSQGVPIMANTQKGGYGAENANDGDMDSYWEGEDHANADLTVDLGAVYTVTSVVMSVGWGGRYEEVTISASVDGVNYFVVVPEEDYFLETVQVEFSPVEARYVRLTITDNSGAPAAQMHEFEVWGDGLIAETGTPIPSSTPEPMATGTPIPTATETPLPTATPVPTSTPVPPTDTPVPTNTPEPANEVELLSRTLTISASDGSAEDWVDPPSWDVLIGMDAVRITYNLHGLCALGGDASAFIFNQSEWMYISLSDYGTNCLDGVQTIEVSLTEFWNHAGTEQLVPEDGIGGVRIRFWYDSPYTVEVISAVAFDSPNY